MQERITAYNDAGLRNNGDVVLQYTPNSKHVGVGLELPDEIANRHFVDVVYGNVPCQTKIGKIFFEAHRGVAFGNLDFPTSEAEGEYFNQLGRDILDAVTGSESSYGLWTWLDRPAVNRLIRLLRKARDSAFGRDE